MTEPGRRVTYMDLPRQFADGEVVRRVAEEFSRCQFVLGPQVAEFESRFARLCGAAHAVGLNSGTDALFLALKALGAGAGDEVITVPNSFVATAGAIVMAGATPVFVDVNAEYLMDPAGLEDAITPRTRAIIPVHLTGNPADMDAVGAVASRHRLAVIEDAARSGRPAAIIASAPASGSAANRFRARRSSLSARISRPAETPSLKRAKMLGLVRARLQSMSIGIALEDRRGSVEDVVQ